MKKIFAISFALIMSVVLTASAFAMGAFVASPSAVEAPKLIAASSESIDCRAELVLASYTSRDTLDDAARAKMEAAYKSIKETDDLGKLNKELDALADKYKIDSKKLSVSDLFDLHHVGCTEHDSHGAFTITIKPNTLDNFIAIMHYNGTEWELLESSVEYGELTFTVDDFSPFAIIAHDGSAKEPLSGAAIGGIVGGSVALVAIAAAVVTYTVVKKKK